MPTVSLSLLQQHTCESAVEPQPAVEHCVRVSSALLPMLRATLAGELFSYAYCIMVYSYLLIGLSKQRNICISLCPEVMKDTHLGIRGSMLVCSLTIATKNQRDRQQIVLVK